MNSKHNRTKTTIEKIARTIFFIFFIGGLFLFMSYTLENVCNQVIFDTFRIPCINTLEAAGIIGFIYIFIYGINFGIKSMKKDMTQRQVPNSHKPDN